MVDNYTLCADEITLTRFRLRDQGVNTAGSGCRLVHIPTGNVCTSELKVPYYSNVVRAIKTMSEILGLPPEEPEATPTHCKACGQVIPPSTTVL